jgi:hypothetical protein
MGQGTPLNSPLVPGPDAETIVELRALAAAAAQLRGVERGSAAHARWVVQVHNVLEEAFGADSPYIRTLGGLTWSRRGTFMVGGPMHPEDSMDPGRAIDREHNRAYIKDLDTAQGLIEGAADDLERQLKREAKAAPRSGDLPARERIRAAGNPAPRPVTTPAAGSNEVIRVINLGEHKLRKTLREMPKEERTIQDRFEDLLVGADLSYGRETERIEYSSKTYTPDFTLTDIDMAVELKLCAREGREKEIIAEINDDIAAYSTRHKNLLFVVYDTGFIRDVDRFAASFEKHESVVVRVVKH